MQQMLFVQHRRGDQQSFVPTLQCYEAVIGLFFNIFGHHWIMSQSIREPLDDWWKCSLHRYLISIGRLFQHESARYWWEEKDLRSFYDRARLVQILRYRCLGLLASSCKLQDVSDENSKVDFVDSSQEHKGSPFAFFFYIGEPPIFVMSSTNFVLSCFLLIVFNY